MERRLISYFLISLILFSFIIRLPVLITPHLDIDEIIYQTLTYQTLIDPLKYSLQGTEILKILPQQMYDHPVFHHPPLFVFCLAFITNLFGKTWMIMLSIISGVLTIILTYDICRRFYNRKNALFSTLIASCCPLLFFCSTRIWIDAFLTLLVTLTIWSFLIALENNRKPYFIFSGIIFGLSILTKQTSILIILTCLYMLFKDGLTKQRSVFFICFLFTAILICSPWYIYFYRIYGTILPLWIKPSHELANTFPFIKTVITRPWHFYISRIVLIAPIYLFAFLNILYLLKKKQIRPEIIWALSFIIPFSILGINGCGYQTRFIAPAIPALAMLSANVFDLENEWIGVLGILLLALGMLTGILNSLISNPSEVIPFYIFFNK